MTMHDQAKCQDSGIPVPKFCTIKMQLKVSSTYSAEYQEIKPSPQQRQEHYYQGYGKSRKIVQGGNRYGILWWGCWSPQHPQHKGVDCDRDTRLSPTLRTTTGRDLSKGRWTCLERVHGPTRIHQLQNLGRTEGRHWILWNFHCDWL